MYVTAEPCLADGMYEAVVVWDGLVWWTPRNLSIITEDLHGHTLISHQY